MRCTAGGGGCPADCWEQHAACCLLAPAARRQALLHRHPSPPAHPRLPHHPLYQATLSWWRPRSCCAATSPSTRKASRCGASATFQRRVQNKKRAAVRCPALPCFAAGAGSRRRLVPAGLLAPPPIGARHAAHAPVLTAHAHPRLPHLGRRPRRRRCTCPTTMVRPSGHGLCWQAVAHSSFWGCAGGGRCLVAFRGAAQRAPPNLDPLLCSPHPTLQACTITV